MVAAPLLTSMKWLSTLVLLLAALVLAAFVFFWERKQPSSEEAAQKAKRVFDVAEKDIRWLEVDHDGKVARFERAAPAEPKKTSSDASIPDTSDARAWRIVRPVADRADPFLVDGLARRVAELQTVRTFEAGARLPSDADAGLAPPRYRITFEAGRGPQTLAAGREAPATNAVFLRTPDGRTCLVSKDLVEGLDRPAEDWRDRTLFDLAAVDLSQAEITRPAGPLRFTRAGEDWRLVAPVDDEAAGGKVQGLLSAITGLRAEAFRPESDAASAGLQPPARQVRLVRRDGRVEELAVGGGVSGSPDRLYVRAAGRPGLAEVAARILTDLDAPADSYRSLRLFTVSAWDAQSVTLVAKGETVELRRHTAKPDAAQAPASAPVASAPTAAEWTAARPGGLSPKAEAVDAVLRDLTDLEATGIAGPASDRASYGLDAPAARAEIATTPEAGAAASATSGGAASATGATPAAGANATTPPEAGRREVVLFGKAAPEAGRVYALREGRPWVLIVPATILDRFGAASFR